MRKGTAPVHTFTLPFDSDRVAKLRVNYAQRGELLVIKTEKDATMQGNIVQVQLSQSETLSFKDTCAVEIQLDLLATDGTPFRSRIYRAAADRVLNEEVLE